MEEDKPKVGRPLKFSSPEELQFVIDEYFKSCVDYDEFTGTGLALAVGSKQLIQDYEGRDGFRDIILRAKLRIENAYERSLRKVGGAHNIFALKNYGWTDQQSIDHTTNGRDIIPPTGLSYIEALALKMGDNIEDEDQPDTTSGA